MNDMKKYRAIFISDVHLGTKWCHAKQLLNLLNSLSYDNIILVGDIVECRKLKDIDKWPDSQIELLNKLFFDTRYKITYILGNHDNLIKEYMSSNVDNVEISMYKIYNTVDKTNYLVEHGHMFNSLSMFTECLISPWIMFYDIMRHMFNLIDIYFKFDTTSSMYIFRYFIKNIMMLMTNYLQKLIDLIKSLNCKGIIFGHLHKPGILYKNDIAFLNCGDWLEHKTLIAEDYEGGFHLITG